MIIFVLIWVLIGSFATTIVMVATGASWGMIALGYVAGGWGGLILGAGVLMLICRLRPETARRLTGAPRLDDPPSPDSARQG